MTEINPVSVNQPQQSKKRNIKGSLAALGAGSIASVAVAPLSLLEMNGMTKFSKKLTKDEVKIVNNAADKIVSEVTNLGEKGVVIKDLRTPFVNVLPLPDWLVELTNPLFQIPKGKNAAFLDKDIPLTEFKKNMVLINREKLPLAVFHELGHAFNFNNSSFWKTLQKSRVPGMGISGLVALFPAFTKDSKAQDGEELTKGQKFKNWMRKYSPVLAFGAMTPMLAEEGMASIRGCKWAKSLLNKNLFNKVLKTNVVAYTTYLTGALGMSLAAFAAKKVKDNSQAKLERKAIMNE